MIKAKQIQVACDTCKDINFMRLDWSIFRLPEGWLFRTRSYNCDDSPSDVEIILKNCYNKIKAV